LFKTLTQQHCWIEINLYNLTLGNGGIAPCILNFSTRWMWVVSLTPRPLYPRGKRRVEMKALNWETKA